MAAPSGAPLAPGAAPPCAGCGARGAPLRCAGCRSALYCDRACQKAAWPEHKALCKVMLKVMHGGVQLRSARAFVLEYWAGQLPADCDVGALLPPDGEHFDEAGAFERCQRAAMDAVFPGYAAAATDGDRARLVQARIARHPAARLGALAVECIWRVCPAALGAVLDAGAQPGDTTPSGHSVLQQALVVLQRPYARSAAAQPHALESARRLLERAQPGDWLVGRPEELPLQAVVGHDPPVLRVVLGMIRASPGGFPARAVAATPELLHMALLHSPAVFVEALLDAGADPNRDSSLTAPPGATDSMAPLHALAVAGGFDTPDFDAKLRLLLTAGAALEGVDSHGWTPLVTAAVRGNAAAFDALLAAGAQASALRIDFSGGRPASSRWTLLHEFAQSDNAAMLTRVLATGALAVDERAGREASRNVTPLLVAAEQDAARACAALLAAGASLAATDANGAGALQTAIEYSAPRVARLLLAAAPPKGALRAGYKRAVKHVVEARRRAAAAAPGDARAAARLVAAHDVAALFA